MFPLQGPITLRDKILEIKSFGKVNFPLNEQKVWQQFFSSYGLHDIYSYCLVKVEIGFVIPEQFCFSKRSREKIREINTRNDSHALTDICFFKA